MLHRVLKARFSAALVLGFGISGMAQAATAVEWAQISGKGSAISTQGVSSTWLLGTQGQIYKRSNGGWARYRGKANQLVARYSGAFHLGGDGKSMYVLDGTGWKQLPGRASYIAAGLHTTAAESANESNRNFEDLWHLSDVESGPDGNRMFYWDSQRNGWKGVDQRFLAKRIAVGGQGHVYRVTKSGDMYHSANKGSSWTKLPGKASEIATLALRPNVVWHLSNRAANSSGKAIYESKDYGRTWSKLRGTATSISLAKSIGGQVQAYHTNAQNGIYGNAARSGGLEPLYLAYLGGDDSVEKSFAGTKTIVNQHFVNEGTELKQLEGSCTGNTLDCVLDHSGQ